MKKVLLMLLCATSFALSSQAVTIHWDTETEETGVSSAILAYYETGSLAFDDTTKQITGATATFTESSVDPTIAYEEGYNTNVGTATPTTGTWYLVLLDSTGDNYKAVEMAAADVSYYTGDISAPQALEGGMGTVTLPTTWTPTPEPCSVALLLLGAAAMATRRKKLVV